MAAIINQIQIISDIHLECYCNKEKPLAFEDLCPPLAEYLFLAGDIGQLSSPHWQSFMSYVSQNWRHVFYVLGNHELYSCKNSYDTMVTNYEAYLAQYPNIHLLNRGKMKITIAGVEYDVLGATMWSQAEFALAMQINDFRHIKYHDARGWLQPISIQEFNRLHTRDCDWLISNLDPTRNTIILTHFPLTQQGTSADKYRDQKPAVRNYYANEMHIELMARHSSQATSNPSLTVISGHTHHSYNFEQDGIRYVANQIGYRLH
jgi:predicted phosphodiesterase